MNSLIARSRKRSSGEPASGAWLAKATSPAAGRAGHAVDAELQQPLVGRARRKTSATPAETLGVVDARQAGGQAGVLGLEQPPADVLGRRVRDDPPDQPHRAVDEDAGRFAAVVPDDLAVGRGLGRRP